MTLEFRETKRPHGRKKILEIDVISTSRNFERRIGIIRPEFDEFEPVSFERFNLAEMHAIAARLGLGVIKETIQTLGASNANANEKKSNPNDARAKGRARRKAAP